MEIAALIISILSLLMSIGTMIVYLSTYVFSKRSIQMVSAESIMSGSRSLEKGGSMQAPVYGTQFEEFEFQDGPLEASGIIKKEKPRLAT